jgi:hypothetical protein
LYNLPSSDLANNKLEGPIPESFSSLNHLNYL